MRPDIRIGAFYALTYGALGVSLPYWPLWLRSRGLAADQIGLVFAAAMLAKVLGTPLAAALADRLDRRRAVIIGLMLLSLAANCLYLPAHDSMLIMAIGFLASFLLAPVATLTDALSLGLAQRGVFDYGRVRLFGSLGFMLVALATGAAIADHDSDLILFLMLTLLALACLGACALPEGVVSGRAGLTSRLQLAGTLALLKRPGLRWFLLATGLIQNSHVAYYAFGTLYWRSAGIDAATIGWLWAEGVIAEIGLFAAGPWLAARLSPAQLIMIGGLGAALRWLALGLSTELAVLVPMQLLHALSFAATHLGAMRYLARNAPPGLSATMQGIYGALPLGIGAGVFYAATGILVEQFGVASAFVAMAVSSTVGIAAMKRCEIYLRQDSRYMEKEC